MQAWIRNQATFFAWTIAGSLVGGILCGWLHAHLSVTVTWQ